jgi:hypothetical protein
MENHLRDDVSIQVGTDEHVKSLRSPVEIVDQTVDDPFVYLDLVVSWIVRLGLED